MFRLTRSRAFGAKVAIGVAAGALASGATAALVASPAGAQTSTVQCPPGSNLQNAINSAPQGATINISGTCTGNFNINPDQDITLQGGILDGGGSGTVLFVGPGATVTLNSLIIQHGNTPGDGGGIFNEGGNVTLISSRVSNNTAGNLGGGIYNDGMNGSFAILGLGSSTVSQNKALQNGGGIFNDGRDGFAVANLSSSSLANNTAPFGGGVYNDGFKFGRAILHLFSSSVGNNKVASEGGGIFNQQAPSGEDLVTLQSSSVSFNVANGGPGSGGGIFNLASVDLQPTSSVFFNNPDNCAPPGSVSGCRG